MGYGAEDTDFGQRLAAAGGTMLWAGGAAAYHQHHFTETPPRHHLLSIVRNANLFHESGAGSPWRAGSTSSPASGSRTSTAGLGGGSSTRLRLFLPPDQ